MPVEKFDQVVQVNVRGTFLMSQAVGRRMIEGGTAGTIINISSVAGIVGGHPDYMQTIGYNTSKGAIISMTRDLATSWSPHNITVNAIAPGWFPTRMSGALIEKFEEQMLDGIPLHRFGNPEDLKRRCSIPRLTRGFLRDRPDAGGRRWGYGLVELTVWPLVPSAVLSWECRSGPGQEHVPKPLWKEPSYRRRREWRSVRLHPGGLDVRGPSGPRGRPAQHGRCPIVYGWIRPGVRPYRDHRVRWNRGSFRRRTAQVRTLGQLSFPLGRDGDRNGYRNGSPRTRPHYLASGGVLWLPQSTSWSWGLSSPSPTNGVRNQGEGRYPAELFISEPYHRFARPKQ